MIKKPNRNRRQDKDPFLLMYFLILLGCDILLFCKTFYMILYYGVGFSFILFSISSYFLLKNFFNLAIIIAYFYYKLTGEHMSFDSAAIWVLLLYLLVIIMLFAFASNEAYYQSI